MLMFTLAISCLSTSNLPWFMDLTFQVPMQYCSLQHWTLLPSPVVSTTGCCFCFGSISILSGDTSPLFSSSILDIYWLGKFIFQSHIFLPFHTVPEVLKAKTLKWFAISFSSGPRFVRTLHHDPFILGGPTRHGSQFHWVRQGCILSPCLFNLYAENIMRNTGLHEAQAGIKIAGRNSNNLRYADDTTLMAESEVRWSRSVLSDSLRPHGL